MQWSSELQAQPTTRASSSRIRRSAAIRASIWSIFAAIRTRSASDGAAERRAARRYSAISASVKPTACASLIAPQEAHRLLVVAAMPARRPVGRRQQPPPLVVAQRLDVHARAFCDLADSHAADYRPVPRYGNQGHSQ